MQMIKLLTVGTIKEKYFNEAIAEYIKRLSRFCKFEIVEVPEYLAKARMPSLGWEVNSLCFSGSICLISISKISVYFINSWNLEKKLEGYVVIFDLKGKEISSEGIAELITNCANSGNSKITFVIGGSNGISSKLLNKADMVIRFGKITFPHQLMRVVATEQIYRAMTIINNTKYHK